MKTRILTALIALPIIIASIVLPAYFPGAVWLFVALAAFALAAGLFEFYSLTKKLELKADAAVGYLGAAALFVGFVFDAPAKAPDLMFATVCLIIIAVLISQTFRFQRDFSKMLTGVGVTLLGVFFLVIFASEIGAYFAGRAFGKHKLAPKISSGKTVEGLIGGLLFAAGGAALATLLFFSALPYHCSIPLALVLATVGVLGDLAESAMKRGSNTKDAASILPGHGGFLDRLDSLLFGAPILYYFARFYFS